VPLDRVASSDEALTILGVDDVIFFLLVFVVLYVLLLVVVLVFVVCFPALFLESLWTKLVYNDKIIGFRDTASL